MEPALRDGQIVLVRPIGRRLRVGDIVVLAMSGGERCVKRVAGGPSATVELEAGRLYVDQRSYDASPRVAGARVETWRVPEGHVFVMGDNLQQSDDSRVWPEPFVPVERIIGVVMAGRRGAPVGFTRGRPDRAAADRHCDPAQRSP